MASALLDEKKVPVAREVPAYSVHLDAARGAAASVVLASHLRLFFLHPGSESPRPASRSSTETAAAPVPRREKRGLGFAHEAVMLFFVLSGFLVGGTVIRLLRQRQWRWKRYLIHRAVRLWMVLLPALALGFTLDTIGARRFLGQGTVYDLRPEGLPWDVVANLRPMAFLGNIFFLQGGRVLPLGTNQPLWSLGYEAWYYVAFPCLALALASGVGLWKRFLMLAAMAAILVFVGREIAEYFSIWLLGAGAALLPPKVPRRFQRLFAAMALGLVAGANALVLAYSPSPFLSDFLESLCLAVAIYAVLHFRDPARNSVYRGSARFLSKISYSLYVTHVPVVCLASAVLIGRLRPLPLSAPTALLLAEVMAPVAAAACAVHYGFEARTDRVRHYLESRL